MKIRTKLLTAVVATATALSCALTASAFTTQPSLTLQGNESSPLTLNNGAATATLTLKASDFKEVKGAKITVELPNNSEKITLSNITVTDADNSWTLNENNYKVVGNKITMVDVFNFTDTVSKENLNLNLNFKVTNASIGKYEVKVTGDFADDAADKIYTVPTTTVNFVIGREYTTVSDGKIPADNETFFIPYGGVFNSSQNFEKKIDGTFEIPDGTTGLTFLKFLKPAKGTVTTFGACESLLKDTDEEKSIQFGSYVERTGDNASFGSLVIASYDLPDKAWAKNYTAGSYANALAAFDGDANALFQNIITAFGAEKIDGKFHPYTYDNKEVVYVAVVKQTRYMWKDNADNALVKELQYAVRCKGLEDKSDKEHTAVGYTVDNNGDYKFSTEIKTGSYSSLADN